IRLTSNRWPLVRLRQVDFVAYRLAKALELSAPEFCGRLLKKVDRNRLQRQPDLDQGELDSAFRLLGLRHSVDHNPEPSQKLIKPPRVRTPFINHISVPLYRCPWVFPDLHMAQRSSQQPCLLKLPRQ